MHAATTSKAGSRTIYHLRDDATGASASILPSYGFNLFDLRLPLGGTVRPVVVAGDGWAAEPSRPARHGFPVLFPFAGRIGGARFSFEGRSYTLAANKPPHAIHGFAYDVPWEVLDHSAGPEGATIAGRFRISRQAPQSLDPWPADAILTLRYTLTGRRLTLDASVENPSPGPLPWSFGLHSYFALPFDRRPSVAGTRVVIPASSYWAQRDNLPTGEVLPVDGTDLDYREGRSMEGLEADIALTGLDRDPSNLASCSLHDDRTGGEIRIVCDPTIREMIVFTPPGQPGVIAVEPYTAMADPFRLSQLGRDSGLRVLPPGGVEQFRLQVEANA